MYSVSKVFRAALAVLGFSGATLPLMAQENIAEIHFSDIDNNLYETEIREASRLGFISGFPDGTFRPDFEITREQIVAMTLAFANGLTDNGFPVSPARGHVFSDVERSRWSADRIETAFSVGLVSGYPDGSFKPARRISRAELMTIMYNASAILSERVLGSVVFDRFPVPEHPFTDTDSHWAAKSIATMYGMCHVASPLNEQGDQYFADRAATRAYAAAAIVRAFNCLSAIFGGR